jgi:hypothetical protein
MARCHSLCWPTQLPDGPALFSLRPENIRMAEGSGSSAPLTLRIRGKVRSQAFHGANELLQVECSDGLRLSVQVANCESLQGELGLEFSAEDAVPVRGSAERI